jgi:hypothetical protein
MGEDSEESGPPIPTANSTNKAPGEKPKFASLTLEERAWLVARLEELRHKGTRENGAWKAELVVALKSTPILDPILKLLETVKLPSSSRKLLSSPSRKFEGEITQVIEAALRVVSASWAPALGDGLRSLVAQEVEKVLWQSKTVVVMRWGALALSSIVGAALLGGTIWGAYKVDGLNKLAKDTEGSIEQSRDKVREETMMAQNAIRTLRDDAKQRIDKQIEEEVDARTKKLGQVFENVLENARKEVTDRLSALEKALAELDSTYKEKRETAFEDRNKVNETLWSTQEQSWLIVLNGRKEAVASHLTEVQSSVDERAKGFKMRFESTLLEANQKVPELGTKILALENQSSTIDKTVTNVDAHLKRLLETQGHLEASVNKLNEQFDNGGFRRLIGVLDIKDGLAVSALAIAVVSLVYAFFSRRRLLRKKPFNFAPESSLIQGAGEQVLPTA